MYHSRILAFSALASTALGATFTVNVGQGGLVYSPATLSAQPGDTIQFDFKGGNHTVTQTSFGDPCNPINNGFNSGFASSSTSFSIVVKNKAALYYYCAAEGHCQAGMVGIINPPSSSNVLEAFKTAASSASVTAIPTAVFGGVLSEEGGTPSTAPGVSATETSSATATTTDDSSATDTATDGSSATETSATDDSSATETSSSEETATATNETSTSEATSVTTVPGSSASSSGATRSVTTIPETSETSVTTVPTSAVPSSTRTRVSTLTDTGAIPEPTGNGAGAVGVGLFNAAAGIIGAAAFLL
ncbi:hypothetical protein H072_366 [Dactylellina haptotyla CBS 200.50]|uniref:Phytocyanin domain-containing protein n=1 Tax=Dactylellina haptotyla (strain CBS 200.50) TaxID=1284197 RepID=S8CD56_DACHA|nr:hypothetical protein H072_366 [Dactylellina haptotyla CBS 200.50]